MLFNSYIFIILFLPIVLTIFYLLGQINYPKIALSWLVAASLFFYAWWNPEYLILIVGSILFNYALGRIITAEKHRALHKTGLLLGVTVNLALLGYYKYCGFFIENINTLFELGFNDLNIILPLAISFFTFQQIAYLVDSYRGIKTETSFLNYCLFVTFFPQLIAGPIVHHQEMMPQFKRKSIFRCNVNHLSVGITIFTIGLFKKVVLADHIAEFSTPGFEIADAGGKLTFFVAWSCVLAYAMQLYFDFSGYSDMAIGLARLFGILLPINFFSPYKATSIIDFWRRWHITLSRFLRDYLYIPLGGNRRGRINKNINLLITMLLGGLWHGAAWNFIIWGGLHGLYLMINNFWRSLHKSSCKSHYFLQFCAWLLTFFAVLIAWVPFRAKTFTGAMSIWESMLGIHGFSLPNLYFKKLNTLFGTGDYLLALGVKFETLNLLNGMKEIIILMIIITLFPNTHQFMSRYRPVLNSFQDQLKPNKLMLLQWRPHKLWAIGMAIVFIVSLYEISEVSEFLYFNF
jgi:D-alanyl-lipoteichoic acid acyltransferase DltB (MBOAT superfamily)